MEWKLWEGVGCWGWARWGRPVAHLQAVADSEDILKDHCPLVDSQGAEDPCQPHARQQHTNVPHSGPEITGTNRTLQPWRVGSQFSKVCRVIIIKATFDLLLFINITISLHIKYVFASAWLSNIQIKRSAFMKRKEERNLSSYLSFSCLVLVVMTAVEYTARSTITRTTEFVC